MSPRGSDAETRLQHGARIANAKALASPLKLGVGGGETVRLIASGPDAAAALKALREAVESGLGEEQEREAPAEAALAWQPVSGGRALVGVSASPGLAIGRLFQSQATRVVVTDRTAADPASEQRQLEQAVETAREQLDELYTAGAARYGKNEAGIFREALFAAKGIADLFVRVDGETRVGVKIFDPALGQTTDINFPGLSPAPPTSSCCFVVCTASR